MREVQDHLIEFKEKFESLKVDENAFHEKTD